MICKSLIYNKVRNVSLAACRTWSIVIKHRLRQAQPDIIIVIWKIFIINLSN